MSRKPQVLQRVHYRVLKDRLHIQDRRNLFGNTHRLGIVILENGPSQDDCLGYEITRKKLLLFCQLFLDNLCILSLRLGLFFRKKIVILGEEEPSFRHANDVVDNGEDW